MIDASHAKEQSLQYADPHQGASDRYEPAGTQASQQQTHQHPEQTDRKYFVPFITVDGPGLVTSNTTTKTSQGMLPLENIDLKNEGAVTN